MCCKYVAKEMQNSEETFSRNLKLSNWFPNYLWKKENITLLKE